MCMCTIVEKCEYLGFSNSLYSYNTGMEHRFDEVDLDDGSTFIGSLTTPYILYGISYQDVYVSEVSILIYTAFIYV